jgi:hypothetical protein
MSPSWFEYCQPGNLSSPAHIGFAGMQGIASTSGHLHSAYILVGTLEREAAMSRLAQRLEVQNLTSVR